MTRKQISFRVLEEQLETSNTLRNYVLKDEGLAFFSMHTGSLNDWNAFIYSMGLIKIKEDFEKFKKILETEEK